MLGKKINPRQTKALDNHPALKGKQSRLPDELQAKIIGSKLSKTAKLKDYEARHFKNERERSIAMNKHPVRAGLARAAIGGLIGGNLRVRVNDKKVLPGGVRGALIGAGTLAGLGEVERRIRNKYYGLDGSEKLSSLTKIAGNLEGRMARRQLTEVCEMAQELLMYMGDDEDLHEWVQNKITTIHDRLSSVHSYVSYEKKNPPMLGPQVLGAAV